MAELERAWRRKHDARGRKRLQVIRLVAQHRLTAGGIAEAAGVSRPTVFNYVRAFQEGGVEKLLATGHARSRRGSVDEATEAELRGKLEKGGFKRGRDAQTWLAGRGVTLALNTVYYWLKKAGGAKLGAAKLGTGQK
jgi:transposase